MSTGPKIGIAAGTYGTQTSIFQANSIIKAIENEKDVAAIQKNEADDVKYVVTEDLRNHIEKAEMASNGRTGIKGAHNKENFLCKGF